MSLRGYETLNTPSLSFIVPLSPVSDSIFVVSSFTADPPMPGMPAVPACWENADRAIRAATINALHARVAMSFFMEDSFRKGFLFFEQVLPRQCGDGGTTDGLNCTSGIFLSEKIF